MTDLTAEQRKPVCPICQGTEQMISDEPPTHQPCTKCTAAPWTIYRMCRRCAFGSVFDARFKVLAVWKDRNGAMWARYACDKGHADYWPIKVQVFRELVAATQEEGA